MDLGTQIFSLKSRKATTKVMVHINMGYVITMDVGDWSNLLTFFVANYITLNRCM
jgi:hypothetical protein